MGKKGPGSWVVRCEEQSTWAPAGQNEGDVGLNGELHSLEKP